MVSLVAVDLDRLLHVAAALGAFSTALGAFSTALGAFSTARCTVSTALGTFSTALGTFAATPRGVAATGAFCRRGTSFAARGDLCRGGRRDSQRRFVTRLAAGGSFAAALRVLNATFRPARFAAAAGGIAAFELGGAAVEARPAGGGESREQAEGKKRTDEQLGQHKIHTPVETVFRNSVELFAATRSAAGPEARSK